MAQYGVPLPTTRAEVLQLDAADELAAARDRFALPDGIVYLDGNSLGPPPREVFARIETVARREWGVDLIRSWTANDWIDLPERVAAGIADLIGAAPHEVVVADSTSINLFKLLFAATRLRPNRRVILSESQNFGTDLYVAQGLAQVLGDGVEVQVVERTGLAAAMDDDVAAVMLTHVDFRTGEMHDLSEMTRAAHDAGALMVWDLAHSAGAVPVDLGGAQADLAVGCGYKYLNGGPGAPAFAYVAERHHWSLESPLWGWMGHAAPFDFDPAYRAAPGVAGLKVGTPPILSLAALECGVRVVAEVGVEALRTKAVALSELLIGLVERDCRDLGLELASPRSAACRGSQVSWRFPEGYAVVQALIARGVIGDFRAPDLMRFGLAPAYLRFVDIWDAVAALREILADREWDQPRFLERAKVT
jgi:kynureninase